MISVTTTTNKKRAKQALASPLVFGKTFADLMVTMAHTPTKEWHDAKVVPYGPLQLSPAAKALHYGLEIFEGHKAFRQSDGEVALFRPRLNAIRFNRSATRMAMPTIPEDLQSVATHILVDLLRSWVPDNGGTLYLRPFLIATEPALGVMPATEHLYGLIASLAGNYFNADNGLSIKVEAINTRAAQGGVGFAKTGGNYAAAMASKQQARQEGFNDVLFLDGTSHRFLEELSAMNIFAVQNGTVVTPPINDTILDGITRRSLIELCEDLSIPVEERPLAIDSVVAGIDDGSLTEMMAVGTAASVTPIVTVGYQNQTFRIGNGAPGPIAKMLGKNLTDIQFGRQPDKHEWMQIVERGEYTKRHASGM